MAEGKIIDKPTQARHLWWDIFLAFFKIGAVTIGGGFVMVPFIEEAIINKKKWMEQEQFLDMLAIAQSAPGVLAINIAVSVGYQIAGVPGALVATIGAALPSFMMIICIAALLLGFQGNRYLDAFFRGAAPAVTMLLFMATFSIGVKAIKDRAGIILILAGLIAIIWLGLHPILAIIAAGIFGALYYK